MRISRSLSLALAGALVSLLLLSASALATPITVNLRVEGSTSTLFEGAVATSAETIETPSSGGPHPCDYASNGPSKGFENGGNASGTPTTALHDAALANGLTFDAEWFGSGVSNGNPGDFFVKQVGSDANGGPPTFPSWGYAVNDTTAIVGGCQIALAPGGEVLWAYNYFNLVHLLSLSGPSSVSAGTPFTVHVVDGRTGEPIAGAVIGVLHAGVTTTISSSTSTDSSGNATVTLIQAGIETLKATQTESVRSNGLAICVHNGNDGTCGTQLPGTTNSALGNGRSNGTGVKGPAPIPELAKIAGVKNGHVYSHRSAPRILAGVVSIPSGATLHQVRISLSRRNRGHCFVFSGRKVSFVKAKCGTTRFFSVGSSMSFSYLLPTRLPAGRYVYDIEAVDNAGHATALSNGVSHVVFVVK